MENPTVYMLPKMIENNKFNELLSDSIENKGWEVKQFTKRDLIKLKKMMCCIFIGPASITEVLPC